MGEDVQLGSVSVAALLAGRKQANERQKGTHKV